jgi:hypothetical protein
MSRGGKRKDQSIQLSDGWAVYVGDGHFLIGQISDDGAADDHEKDTAKRRSGERHKSVVISTADMHLMVTAIAA